MLLLLLTLQKFGYYSDMCLLKSGILLIISLVRQCNLNRKTEKHITTDESKITYIANKNWRNNHSLWIHHLKTYAQYTLMRIMIILT